MSGNNYYNQLKSYCAAEGADMFGVADISSCRNGFALSEKIRSAMTGAVSLAVRASPAVLDDIEGAPTRLYFHHYRTLNGFLDQLALKTALFIQKEGYQAVPIAASQIVDWQKQTAHLSHKHIGVLAGIGWIGRSNLLVAEELGARFRLVTVLTDMPLAFDAPRAFGCGECVECIGSCPAGAINRRPEEFEHMKCFDMLKDFQRRKLVDQYICGVCVQACAPRQRQPVG